MSNCKHDEGWFPDGNCAKCDLISYSEYIENLKAQVEMLEIYVKSLIGTDIREHNSESTVWLSAWRNTTKRLAKETLEKLKEARSATPQMRGSE